MSEIISLKRARKGVLMADKRTNADRNALQHGLSKDRKAAAKAVHDAAAKHLDGHKRDG